MVVEGGDTVSIASTIAAKKTPGTGTFGEITTEITDASGSTHTIKFGRVVTQPIHVALSISGLSGYSGDTLPIIQASIVDYLNSLKIAAPVNYFDLLVPAKLDNSGLGLTYKIVSMTIKKGAGAFGVADLTMLYNEAATGTIGNVVITVV